MISHDLVLALHVSLQGLDGVAVQCPEAVQQATCLRELLGAAEGEAEGTSPATGHKSSFCTQQHT